MPASRDEVMYTENTEEYLFLTEAPYQDKLSRFKTNVIIDGHRIPVLIDTGCSTNILTAETFDRLQKQKQYKLNKSKVSLIPYGAQASDTYLRALGTINCLVESNSRYAQDEFFIVNANASNLIGGDLALRLNLVTLHVNRVTDNNTSPVEVLENDLVRKMASIPKNVKPIINKFKRIFYGMGKLKNDKIKLHINKDITPVAQKARRIPFHLRQKVDEELERLRKEDIIEDVVNEPTPWVSPIVVLPKKSDPNKIRMCIDMRQANKAIERTRHPGPCIEDLVHDLNGATTFCKLDMNNAFLQLELDEQSRYITAFATHQGIHRFKRLNFGTTSASEELQMKLEQILRGIENCKNIADDIILFAKSKQEMDETLDAVLQRLAHSNLTLNLEKCEFYKTEIEFFSFIFSANGISPSEEKVKAIKQLASPKKVHEVRSFLGMTNFLSRFIINYSEISTPLRHLTKKDIPWKWDSQQEVAFNKLKASLSSNTVMSYFDPKKVYYTHY